MSRPVALVTGASAGIGFEFGLQLAARGYDLILVARRRDRLDDLAARARALGAERVEVLAVDLAAAGAAAGVATAVAPRGLDVELLVNNAGFGTHGRFERLAAEREHDEIAVNVDVLVGLTHAFLPAMLERGRGGVINVASTAAFQPVPYMAVYGATKAFVRSFSEALHEEVHPRGVRVLALCPGPTATEFFGTNVSPPRAPAPVRTVSDVVATGLRAFDAGEPVVVDGAFNRVLVAFSAILPRRAVTRLAARIMGPNDR
jgi:short-subunit dehydrogenase